MLFDTNLIIALCALLSLVSMLLILVTLRLQKATDNKQEPSEFQGTGGLRGRIEKLEHALNDLQTNALRSLEISSGRIDELQKKLNFISNHLELDVEALIQEAEKLEDEVSSVLERVRSHEDHSESADASEQELVEETQDVADESFAEKNILASEAKAEDEDSVEASEEKEPVEVKTDHITLVESEQLEKAEDAETQDKKLSSGLSKSRQGFFAKFKSLFIGKPALSDELLEEAEALLISSDLGVACSQRLIAATKQRFSSSAGVGEEEFWELLKAELLEILNESVTDLTAEQVNGLPKIVLVLGVNGVGKTTSIAKLANRLKSEGKVLLIAADTFRAAAVEQLKHWGERVGVAVYAGAENQKPATVVFDGLQKAKAENYDIVLIDTAGRLHNKANLMQELDGIGNVIQKFSNTAPDEVLLVVDACTGQNALNQARDFNDIIKLSGIVITKLDGTPKGGIVVAIKNELGIPVRFIGVGEGVNDLQVFSAQKFINALLDSDSESLLPEGHMAVNAEARRMRRS